MRDEPDWCLVENFYAAFGSGNSLHEGIRNTTTQYLARDFAAVQGNEANTVELDAANMTEHEVALPVLCPICGSPSMTVYRSSVVIEGLATGSIRLYSGCHVAAWEASGADLDLIHASLWENNASLSLECGFPR